MKLSLKIIYSKGWLSAMNKHKDLLQFIKEANERETGVEHIFYDLETFTVNRKAIKTAPTKQQAYTYSFACSFWLNDGSVGWDAFPTFADFFKFCRENGLARHTKSKKFRLIAHNGEKYDNHFLLWELKHVFNCKSMLLDSRGLDTIYIQKKPKALKKIKNTVLEGRVRSSTRLELHFNLDNYVFECVDTFLKTGESLAQAGYKLVNLDLMSDEYLKTTLDYGKYDSDTSLRVEFLHDTQKAIFDDLTDDDMIYIRNDVILLAYLWKYYSRLYYGFDVENRTKTQGIMKSYTDNVNSSFRDKKMIKWQLLKEYDTKKNKRLNLSDYKIGNMTAFDYYRRFYKGGLNLYNDKHVGKIIKRDGFSIDINSSYPTIMYTKKMPSALMSIDVFDSEKMLSVTRYDDSVFTLFTMRESDVNRYILSKLKSKILKNAIVKYYNAKGGLVYLNNVIIEELERIENVKFGKMPISSISEFYCEPFGGRDIIAYYYFIKTQGKMKYALETTDEWYYINPSNIVVREGVEKPAEYNYSSDDVAGAKVNLNGLYGIPALSACFDAFRIDENEKVENLNGGRAFKNKERNIVFSTCVTAYAFANLISPFENLTPAEIDEYFWYADTDSLYMDKRALPKLPKTMFHFANLGGWDIEHTDIKAFYAFNHKKYCLIDDALPTGKKLCVRCGGVDKAQVKSWIKESNDDIEYFINRFFKDGCTVKNTRGILTRDLTIAIYNGHSQLKQGGVYPLEYSREIEEEMNKFIEEFKKSFYYNDFINSEFGYIELGFCSISYNDMLEDRDVSNNVTLKDTDRLVYDYKQAYKRVVA